eukprot:790528_1
MVDAVMSCAVIDTLQFERVQFDISIRSMQSRMRPTSFEMESANNRECFNTTQWHRQMHIFTMICLHILVLFGFCLPSKRLRYLQSTQDCFQNKRHLSQCLWL